MITVLFVWIFMASNDDTVDPEKMLFTTKNYLSQRTTKPTIRLVRPAKTQISLYIHKSD